MTEQALTLDFPSAPRVIRTDPSSRPVAGLDGFEHGFETIDGARLHYVSGGRDDGEVIVLLAGFPESWFAWRKIMPLLAADYRIIAPDLPVRATPIGRWTDMTPRPWRPGCMA
jgi:hypothetical protein